ncbi:MAG: hypothetical protein IJC56_00820 [Clostridia bacterium]|nr:hypothetical protein [Clostridia bacterium]
MKWRHLLIAIIFLISLNTAYADETDNTLIAIVEKLECRHDYFDTTRCIDYLFGNCSAEEMRTALNENYSSLEAIQEFGITPYDTLIVSGDYFWESSDENPYEAEYIVELYSGENGDILVTARQGDKIHCAQYINCDDPKVFLDTGIPNKGVFSFEGTNTTASYWAGAKFSYTYFTDGSCVQHLDLSGDGYSAENASFSCGSPSALVNLIINR